MIKFAATILCLLCLGSTAWATDSCEAALGAVYTDAGDPFGFRGFTAPFLKKLGPQIENFKQTDARARELFKGMRAIFDLDYLALLSRENALILGPKGGAKTDHLHWLLDSGGLWSKQVGGQTPISDLLGGRVIKDLEEGRETYNFHETMMDASVVLLDEWSNGSELLHEGLYSMLNPRERWITVRGKKIVSKLETLFATSNLSRAQIRERFDAIDSKLGSASLNRFAYTALVSNWPTFQDMLSLDELRLRRSHLLAVKEDGSAEESARAEALLAKLESQAIDWSELRRFARHAFRPTRELSLAAAEFARISKEHLTQAKLASLQPGQELFEPAADWSERLREGLLPTILNSAALDYLLTHSLEEIRDLKEPIKLGAESLWRAAFMATTIGPGITAFDPTHSRVAFNQTFDRLGRLQPLADKDLEGMISDLSDAQALQTMRKEQEIFNLDLQAMLEQIASVQHPASRQLALLKNAALDPLEFALEERLARPSFETEIRAKKFGEPQP